MSLSPFLSRSGVRRSSLPVAASPVVPYVYDLVRRPFPLEARVADLLLVLLNPSSAGGEAVPPTLRRCDAIALSLGHAAYRVVHLFAYPASDPRLLVSAAVAGVDIVGPRNDEKIAAAVRGARRILVAWGSFRSASVRCLVAPRAGVVAEQLLALATCPLECLAAAADGAPCHPLFVRADTTPRLWRSRLGATPPPRVTRLLAEPAPRVLPFAPVAATLPPQEPVARESPVPGRVRASLKRVVPAASVAPVAGPSGAAPASTARPSGSVAPRARRQLPGIAEERAVVLPLL